MEWIKCIERMPEPNEYILMYAGGSLPVMHGYWRGHDWISMTHGNYSLKSITHWKPLPEPPPQESPPVYIIQAASVPIFRLKELCKKQPKLHDAVISLRDLERLIQEFDKGI